MTIIDEMHHMMKNSKARLSSGLIQQLCGVMFDSLFHSKEQPGIFAYIETLGGIQLLSDMDTIS
jgi:hypothetical protein